MKKLFLIPLSIYLCAFAPPSIERNNQGVEDYKNEKYKESLQSFAQALARDPLNSVIHLNLGDVFLKNGEPQKALGEFESIPNDPKADNETKFQAMFNAGVVATEMKDIDKALNYYQQALNFKPDSVEAKTNIELLLRDKQGGGGGGKDQKQDQNKNQDDKKQQEDKKDQDDKNRDNKDQNQNKDQNKDQKPEPKSTPKPFDSKNLNESDVRRILEELKRQEQEIRSKQQHKKRAPERPVEKDW